LKLSVVIPCYNEVATIGPLIEAVRRAPGAEKEIIVVDDGSVDGTSSLLEGALIQSIDVLVSHCANRGKGAAVRSGVACATGEIVIIQDADLEYDPSHFPELIEPILAGRADVVYGSRFHGGRRPRGPYPGHRLCNLLLTRLSCLLNGMPLTDLCTCHKAFRREVLQAMTIEERGFGVDAEITAKLARGNVRVVEVGVSYHGRTRSEGKKLGWRDALRILYSVFRYNFVSLVSRHRRSGDRPTDIRSPMTPLARGAGTLDK